MTHSSIANGSPRGAAPVTSGWHLKYGNDFARPSNHVRRYAKPLTSFGTF